MTRDAGVVRNAKSLRRALNELNDLAEVSGPDRVLLNMILAARFIAAAALKRKESRGGHYRSDYPGAVPGLARRTFMTLDDLFRIERPRRTLPAAAGAEDCRP
jgi:L-aspartate oxidase